MISGISHMFKKIFLVCFLLSGYYALAQKSEADSLFQLYNKTVNIKEKVRIGVDLVWSYRNKSKYNEARSLANGLLDQVNKDFSKAMQAALRQRMANIYEELSVYDTALIHINKAIQLAPRDPQAIQAKQEFDRVSNPQRNGSKGKATTKKPNEGIFGGLFGKKSG